MSANAGLIRSIAASPDPGTSHGNADCFRSRDGPPTASISVQDIEGEQLAKTHSRLEALRAGLHSATDSEDEGDNPRDEAAPVEPQEQQQLWVDTHAPRSYLQLLSAETANANVLSWLKSWDRAVFGTLKQAQPPAGLLSRKRALRLQHSRLYVCGLHCHRP